MTKKFSKVENCGNLLKRIVNRANDMFNSALHRNFGGRGSWHFITRQNKPELSVHV